MMTIEKAAQIYERLGNYLALVPYDIQIDEDFCVRPQDDILVDRPWAYTPDRLRRYIRWMPEIHVDPDTQEPFGKRLTFAEFVHIYKLKVQ